MNDEERIKILLEKHIERLTSEEEAYIRDLRQPLNHLQQATLLDIYRRHEMPMM